MRVGVTWPYDSFPQAPDATRDIFTRLNPDSVIIPSHAAAADFYWLFDNFPNLEFTIRQKTGPGHLGTYPSDIIDYREWDSERSLGDSLFLLKTYGKTLRVILGNEPDIEMAAEPVDQNANLLAAINAYELWWSIEAPKIRAAFPGVQLAPAPLSQGNYDRFLTWAPALNAVYQDADFIVCHCYIPLGDMPPSQWGEQYRWFYARGADKPLIIGETNDNGQYGSLSDTERAQRYAAYIESVAASGMVDEVNTFTLPGGASDASAPSWWFLTPEMADVIGAANRMPVIADPPTEPVEVTPVARTDDEAIIECRKTLWLAVNPGLALNPDAQLYKYWSEHVAEMGSPVSPELDGADNKYQAFTRGVWRWLNDGQNTVEKIAA